jgi:CBS domain-containing protein
MGLYENMQNEPVSRLALRDPVTASLNDTIRDVVGKMREKDLGCVIVVDEDRKPLGMFTESMLTQLVARDLAALEEPLERHIAERWPWVKLSDPIALVLEAMSLKNVRFLCVVDDDGRLAGLTGQKGLMEYVAEHFPRQVMVQRIGGTPYTHEREGA